MGRSPCCDKAKVKKGPWSVEEDLLLKNFISNFGTAGNWISLPKKAGLNRCGKSCRLRWLNYLRPNIKHGEFTEEEDYMIYTLYNTIGSRWSLIASKLQGRTDNDVKNYWNTKLRRKILAGKFKNISFNCSTPAISETSDVSNYGWQNLRITKMGPETNNDSLILQENYSQSCTTSSSVTQEMSSHSGTSSSVDFSQSGSALMMSSSEGDEFWMDLFNQSFDDDDVVVSSQLIEEKISEIASLLDVFDS